MTFIYIFFWKSLKKLKKLELSPQNFRYDVLHLLYSALNLINVNYLITKRCLRKQEFFLRVTSRFLKMVRGRLQTTLTSFWLFLTTYPPPSPFVDISSLINVDKMSIILSYPPPPLVNVSRLWMLPKKNTIEFIVAWE